MGVKDEMEKFVERNCRYESYDSDLALRLGN
jgi:hypothetical protein